MPNTPRLKAYSIAKLIIAYEHMKSKEEKLYEEMLYLIKGVQQRTITWEEVSANDKRYKRLPGVLEKMINLGYFKRAGNKTAMCYITEAGRDRLSEVFGILEESAKTVKLKRKFMQGRRDKEVIERRGADWRQNTQYYKTRQSNLQNYYKKKSE